MSEADEPFESPILRRLRLWREASDIARSKRHAEGMRFKVMAGQHPIGSEYHEIFSNHAAKLLWDLPQEIFH